MNRVQKPSNSECCTPSSESFRFNFSVAFHFWCTLPVADFVSSPEELRGAGRDLLIVLPAYAPRGLYWLKIERLWM
jgi:hypothetical protein